MKKCLNAFLVLALLALPSIAYTQEAVAEKPTEDHIASPVDSIEHKKSFLEELKKQRAQQDKRNAEFQAQLDSTKERMRALELKDAKQDEEIELLSQQIELLAANGASTAKRLDGMIPEISDVVVSATEEVLDKHGLIAEPTQNVSAEGPKAVAKAQTPRIPENRSYIRWYECHPELHNSRLPLFGIWDQEECRIRSAFPSGNFIKSNGNGGHISGYSPCPYCGHANGCDSSKAHGCVRPKAVTHIHGTPTKPSVNRQAVSTQPAVRDCSDCKKCDGRQCYVWR